MHGYLLAPLLNRPSPHFDPGKTRLETLAIMLAGLANGRTVNLGHLANQFPGTALHASSYRRLQRFFEYVRLDGDVVARLIVRLLNLKGPKLLALDRTNWKLGKTDINILVLAVVTRRFKVPLMWLLLSHRGHSSTSHRIELIQRFLRVFGTSLIEALLADREFIGDERLVDHAAFGHWRRQTFVAAPRHDRHDAPWVMDGTMNRTTFDTYVETQLAPVLSPW